MNKLIDKSLSALFKLADRITGRVVGGPHQDDAPLIPPKIRFTKEDVWVQRELFE